MKFEAVSGILIVGQSLADVPPGDQWLTTWESDYAATRRVPKRRDEWRLGRWTAKLAVGEWTGSTEPASIEIRPRADGAPEAFVQGEPAACVISLSHSNGRAICAVVQAGAAVGCDIEVIEARERSFAADYFTADELSYVDALADDRRALAMTLVWSAKECALKAIGEGLRLDTREVEVDMNSVALEEAGPTWRRLEVVRRSPRTIYSGWWRVDAPFVIAVVSADVTSNAPLELPRID